MLSTQKHRSFRTLLLAVSIEPQEIGARLRLAREQRGWTQMAFANAANVSISSVQRWENGSLPPVRELIRLAGVLEIDPEQLVELAPTDQARLVEIERRVEETDAKLDRILELLEAPAPPAKAKRRRSS